MRIALGISYEGTAYYGWQSQVTVPSIQASLETALSKVADHPVTVTCAGRTDAGVHALGQVAHFDTTAERNDRAWLLGTNANLPRDIRVDWVQVVTDDFHARFSATAREYRYVIFTHPVHSALLRNQVAWSHHKLDASRMAEAAQYLLGEHDFSSFRAAQCQAKSPVRCIKKVEIYQRDKCIFMDIKANAFLHHMVRNIAGVLMTIGACKREPIWAKEILEARTRLHGNKTAPASGLYFMQVEYPEEFGLLQSSNSLLFC